MEAAVFGLEKGWVRNVGEVEGKVCGSKEGRKEFTLKVPQPYTCPSCVRAKVALSPAATCVKMVSAGKQESSMAVGVDSFGLSSLSD